ARSDQTQQEAIEVRAASDLIARDKGKQRPIATAEQEESRAADQCRAQMRIVSGVTKPRADRAPQVLGRELARSFSHRSPPPERANNSKIANGVDPERRGNSHARGDGAAERRANRAADIEADAIGGYRGMKILLGNEPRDDGLPSRRRQRAGHSDEKGKQQQVSGGCPAH